MRLRATDHVVITTRDLGTCPRFYAGVLGMTPDRPVERHNPNIHTRKAEFLPAAGHPACGSLDLRLMVDGSLDAARREIEDKGYPVELGQVGQHGARRAMRSIYLRDPDGNLVELCNYE